MNSEENKAEEIKEETEIPEETTENEAVENKEEAAEEKKETSDKKGLFKNKNAKYEKEIEELGQKLAEAQDRFQRTLAEFDNFRKRTMKEKASMYDDGVRDTIEKLLPLFDNLERAISSVEGKVDDEDPLLKGVKMTDKQLKKYWLLGREEIKALG